MKTRLIPIACWAPKATNGHFRLYNVYCFPLQQRLNERATLLRYTSIACFVHCCITSSISGLNILLSVL